MFFCLFLLLPGFHLHITAYPVVRALHLRKQVSINLFSQLYYVSAVAYVLYITFQLYLSHQMGGFPRRRHLYLQLLDFFFLIDVPYVQICDEHGRPHFLTFCRTSDLLPRGGALEFPMMMYNLNGRNVMTHMVHVVYALVALRSSIFNCFEF